MTLNHSTFLVASMALLQSAQACRQPRDYGQGRFFEFNFYCDNMKYLMGSICPKETYKKSNCELRHAWWDEPECSFGDREIKSEGCAWYLWPRKTITCSKPARKDYGCGCGKSPRSCQRDCTCYEELYHCPSGFRLEKNTDYHGNDIECGRFGRAETNEAASACRQNSACRGFSLRDNGERYNPWCLKHTLDSKTSRTNHHFCVKTSRRMETEEEEESVAANAPDMIEEYLVEEEEVTDELDEDLDGDLTATPPPAEEGTGTPIPADAPVPLAETLSHIESVEQFCEYASAQDGLLDVPCAKIHRILGEVLTTNLDGILDVCDGTDLKIGDLCWTK